MTDDKTSPAFADDVRAAADLLESIARDHRVLDQLSKDNRRRLQLAVAAVFNPDPVTRRKNVKADKKTKKIRGAQRVDALLHETGIRSLRRQPVFTTPNVFPPLSFTPNDIPPEKDGLSLLAAEVVGGGLQPAAPSAGLKPRGYDGTESTRSDSHQPVAEVLPEFRAAPEEKHCYVCKQMYSQIHHFYDQLCPSCATLNFAKRTEVTDLRGRVALLTGGRVKIGYQAGLKLLRCGAHLIVTTRFPRNSAERYAAEPDFDQWKNRIEIHGLDLRHTPSVEAFCTGMLATHSRLDFIVNNACQTVRRPPEFYRHMLEGERAALAHMPESAGKLLAHRHSTMPGLTHSAELSQIALLPEDIGPAHLFPEGKLDQDLQQVDLRGRNSWRLLMAEVSTVELLEVQLVNAIAPFIINARLKPLMLRTANRDKHIVNVSAVEGQFYRTFKTTRHPHTNMAKAALNMMTRTAATDYYSDGIHMNAVDTGWVTDEDPAEIAARKTAEHRFHPPLDIVDGAARIVDPIISGLNTGEHFWGKFLKDYLVTDW